MSATASYRFSIDTAALTAARTVLSQFKASIAGTVAGLVGGMGLSAAAVMGFKKAVTEAADMESFITNFRVLLGSASGARAMAESLNEISAATHLSIDGLSKAASTMLSFGVAGDQVVPVIKQLGDVSGGNAERFGSLALAFGQTAAAGKLMGQEVLQYINAGFNPLQEISRTTGKSMGVLRAEMEAGSISAAMVADAFRSATSAGGMFFGFTEENAKTFNGRMATMANRVTNLFREFGKPVNDALGPLLDSASEFAKGLADSAKSWGGQMAQAIGTVRSLFATGQLGEVLNLSLRVGFAAAVNYGAALLNATVETMGIMMGTNIKTAMDLLGALTTMDFWKGMGNAFLSIAHTFAALLSRLVAGVLESMSHIKGLGVLKKGAQFLRSDAAKDEAAAADRGRQAGANIEPLWQQYLTRLKDMAGDMKEAFSRNFANAPKLVDDFEAMQGLLQLLGANAKTTEAAPEPADRALATPATGDAAAAIGAGGRGKVDTMSDRLSRIGLFIGGQGGPRGQKAQEDTAKNTQRIHEELLKLNEDRLAHQQAFAMF